LEPIANLALIAFKFILDSKKGVLVDIPNVVARKSGKHQFSPEALDAGFPIRVETTKPITVTNILFCTVEFRKPKRILYNFPLKETVQINGLNVITIPWKEADKAALIGLAYQEKRAGWNDRFYVAVYDHFTEKAWASREPFEPFLLDHMAIQCDLDLDKEYAKILGYSLRELNRAKTPEERMRIAGITATKGTQDSEPTKPFDGFICYKRSSGEDFAEHLQCGLNEFGFSAFLDTLDIPARFRGSDEWSKARDKTIVECKTFLLILTAGFENSPEIKKELRLARQVSGKEFVYFKHRGLDHDIKIDLGNEVLDLGKQQQTEFDNKNDLLRKAHQILIEHHTVSVPKKSVNEHADSHSFLKHSKFILLTRSDYQGLDHWHRDMMAANLIRFGENKLETKCLIQHFKSGYDDEIWAPLKEYERLMKRYKISGVPSLALQRVLGIERQIENIPERDQKRMEELKEQVAKAIELVIFEVKNDIPLKGNCDICHPRKFAE